MAGHDHIPDGGEIKAVTQGATEPYVHDQLAARLSQLDALLTAAHGGGMENFDNLSPEVRDSYLACCWSLARECRELARLLC